MNVPHMVTPENSLGICRLQRFPHWNVLLCDSLAYAKEKHPWAFSSSSACIWKDGEPTILKHGIPVQHTHFVSQTLSNLRVVIKHFLVDDNYFVRDATNGVYGPFQWL